MKGRGKERRGEEREMVRMAGEKEVRSRERGREGHGRR